MDPVYHCPKCRSALKRMSRNLDFFCRGCYTSVVVLDDGGIEMLRVEDAYPTRLSANEWQRGGRGTEPLVTPAITGRLNVSVLAS